MNTSWIAQIKVNRQDTVFKLDTGAEVSAVTQAIYMPNLGNLPIRTSKGAVWYGPSQTK